MSSTHHAASDEHDAHGHGDDHDHGADDHDAHDHAEPVPPEPESPAWLPLLGAGLFLIGLLGYLFTRTPEPPAEGDAAAKAPAAAAPLAAPPAPPAAPPGAVLRPRPLPAGMAPAVPNNPTLPTPRPPTPQNPPAPGH